MILHALLLALEWFRRDGRSQPMTFLADRMICCSLPLSLAFRGTETQRHRDTETQRHRDTETQRHRDTEIQRHRDTEIQRYRDTETQRHSVCLFVCIVLYILCKHTESHFTNSNSLFVQTYSANKT